MPPSAVVMALPQSPPAHCRLSVVFHVRKLLILRRQLRRVSGVCEGGLRKAQIPMNGLAVLQVHASECCSDGTSPVTSCLWHSKCVTPGGLHANVYVVGIYLP